MNDVYLLFRRFSARCGLLLLWLLLLLGPGRLAWAQENCLLVSVPLADRVAAATLIVEAGVGPQQTVEKAGHLYTLSELTVYKIFRGTVPLGLRLAEPGGTLGLRREVVSPSVTLAPGQQGLFLLEPNPALPGSYRLVAGPQGLVRYDLTDRTATEPFGRYASIAAKLYPVVEALAGQPVRTLRANAALAGRLTAARPLAQPVVSSFTPTQLTAGTGAVLTINGTNFGPTRGTGRVEFPDANAAAGTFTAANPSDYLVWSDTEIQVRVPSLVLATNGVAGTGIFRVVNTSSETGTSPTALVVRYALSNVVQSGGDTPNRPRLINDDGQGGYTLQYAASFTDASRAGATASFERALLSWACATRLRRVVGSATTVETSDADGVNVVRFGTVPTGVLAQTRSYYSGCIFSNGMAFFSLVEMDYVFSPMPTPTLTWQFGPALATSSQVDFESVALHELGHGTQLNHIIDPPAVMHFAISNGENKRTLSAASDVAGGTDVFTFSNTNPCSPLFSPPSAAAIPASCSPLPVELVSFEARYDAGRGTRLRWATASELRSAYFAVEAQEAGIGPWTEILRQPATGTSTSRRTYDVRDSRPLTGSRYYRLRQVDTDGQTSYSPVAAVAGAESDLVLYPSPVASRLHVSGPARTGRLVFYDFTGRAVAQFELMPGPHEVDVSPLRPGLYHVEWTDGLTSRRGRVQKQ